MDGVRVYVKNKILKFWWGYIKNIMILGYIRLSLKDPIVNTCSICMSTICV